MSDSFVVEKVMKIRRNKSTGTIEVQVHWEGYTVKDRTWEPLREIRLKCEEVVEEFKESHPKDWNKVFRT